jgi:crossover junction endodeoxyribonuclease RuvC
MTCDFTQFGDYSSRSAALSTVSILRGTDRSCVFGAERYAVSMEHSAPPSGLRILGIDPGLQVTGYAVLETRNGQPRACEAGVIRSAEGRQTTDMARRLQYLYDGIVEVLEQLKPRVAVVEQLFAHYDHPRTAILMAHARGVLFLAAAQRGLPVVSYNATRIKKTITGNGRASKEQVQRTIQRELGLAQLPEPPDVADALAAALCHHYVVKLSPSERGEEP